MLPKPDTCRPCPLYQDGRGFVPDQVISGAEIEVRGQNPGELEEQTGTPFVGESGHMLDSIFFPAAGLSRDSLTISNTLRCRVLKGTRRTNDLPPTKILNQAVKHCRQYDPPPPTRLAVAAGSLAWKSLGGQGSISDWRGCLQGSLYGTLHPADLLRDATMRGPTRSDWRKIPSILDGSWPQPLPAHKLYTAKDQHEAWFEGALQAPHIYLDTEYVDKKPIHTRLLRLMGLWYTGAPYCLQIWWMGSDDPSWVRARFRDSFHHLVTQVPVVFHNWEADLPVLKGAFGIQYGDYKGYDDTMLAHGVLWPDYPHEFEFLQSVYGQYKKVKHFKRLASQTKEEEEEYNTGDTVELEQFWTNIQKEFETNPGPHRVYREQLLPLIPIILEAEENGIRVDLEAMHPLLQRYREQKKVARQIAACTAQFPLNLNGPQLKQWIYGVCGVKVRKSYKTKRPTLDKGIVTELRQQGLWFNAEEEDEQGLSVEQALERIEQGADPVLEARALDQQADAVLKYVEEMGEGRIYPSMALHPQATGRWSTTEPPVAQYYPDVEDLLHPEPGEQLVEWDWSQMEPRILAYWSNDLPTIQAFERGEDVYRAACLDAFGRVAAVLRSFTKSVIVLRSNYGGDPSGAGKHPAAKVLGLPGSEITRAARSYNNAHPAKTAFWNQTIAKIDREGKTTTIGGRHRLAHRKGPSTYRELFNLMMQGSVVDILNLTIIAIKQQCPRARVMWTKHDSGKFAVKDEDLDIYLPIMQTEVTLRKWRIGNYDVCFPAVFKVRR